MTKRLLNSVKGVAQRLLLPVPSHILNNFVQIDKDGLRSIEESIREHYHKGWRSTQNYSKEMYEEDLKAHLCRRLETDRTGIVPWLDHAGNLKNKRLLEIGCGTGSSTVALAEQGAKVTGIDLDEGALLVAQERAKVYGVEAEFRFLNAQEISSTFPNANFDLIIFFACLEHMTIAERISSIRDAWKMLPSGGLLVVIETPNRLWYFDGHTSMLPFYHWLPNELAFAYSKFSSRENFRELYNDYNPVSKEHFLRRGRGVSFHEFDLALGNTSDLKVISSLSQYQGTWFKLKKSRMYRRYKSNLRSIYPKIHEGFFDDYLYLIIQKV
jgi:S-adenosylmethionine-dependent methyltransferase